MGEKITRRTRSTERDRARLLRQALKNNTPIFSVGAGKPTCPDSVAPGLSEANPELQSAYLEQLIESAPEAISILDPDMRIIRLNGEFTRIFGFSPEEALGQKLEPLIVPPDRSAETRWIQDTLVQGRKVALETKRKHKDGSLIDVFISSTPVVMAGKPLGICVLYRDISDQKRAEALSSALLSIAEKANSAKDLQHFYAATHNIVAELMYARNFYIALYDPLTQLLNFPYFVDEADPRPVAKKLGKGLTEYVLRTGLPLLCTPEVFEKLVAQGEVELIGAPSLDWLGVPLKVGSNVIGVVVVQSYSGNVRFAEKEKNILGFVSQQLASAVEHKRNEEALRNSEARYRSLIQSAVYGIYRCNLEGKFLDVNPALVTMLGYEAPEAVMALDPQKDLFVDGDELSRLIRDFRAGARLNSVEVRWKRKDGKTITVRLSGRTVQTLDDTLQAMEIIAEDVTEQRVLENQFRQAQKMEAVGRLAGGVAHDFNNLLMVISGYTEVLLEHTGVKHPLYPKIQAIHQATERATGVTRQLLTFSRKQMLELKVVDVNAIVADMERLLRPLIGEGIHLQTKLSNDLGRTRADAGQIEQVIMNLVVNSKDAMPNGGKITIQTANVVFNDDLRPEYSYIKPGAYVMLAVSDNGHGMDKETQARIFEPFFTTKEKGKGTGLGLSTVYGIVEQSGGYVLVHSDPGQGTTFRIYLPRVQKAAEEPSQLPLNEPKSGGSETVLLVEDEESVRELVRETLESKGYRVLEAENGEAALRLTAKLSQPVDVLITDVVMPGMSGRELWGHLSASCPNTKVLYLSGYTEDAIVHEGVLDAGTAFLQKPFTLHALTRKLREVLGESPPK